MRLKLDYGSDGLTVDLPGERTTVIEPVPVPAVANPAETLSRAIAAPIGKPPLRTLLKPGQRIGISVCDIDFHRHGDASAQQSG
jgi:hypothetical protein